MKIRLQILIYAIGVFSLFHATEKGPYANKFNNSESEEDKSVVEEKIGRASCRERV